MKIHWLLFVLLSTTHCSVRRTSGNSNALIADNSNAGASSSASTLAMPSASMDSFALGPLQFARLTSDSHLGSETYYKYQICNAQSPSSCTMEGKLLWGSLLFPTLGAGDYIAKVTSCTQGYNPPSPEVCENELDLPFTQTANVNNDLYSMVLEELSIAQALQSKATLIQEANSTYAASGTPNPSSGPFDTVTSQNFDQVVQNQLSYGPDVTGAMINSSYNTQVSNGSQASTSTTTQTTSSTTAASPTTAAAPAQSGTFYGSILVSLGIPTVLLGVIVGGISWYAPKLAQTQGNNLSAQIESGAKGGTDALKSIDVQWFGEQAVDILRRLTYGPLGYIQMMDEDLLNKKFPQLKTSTVDNKHNLETAGSRKFLVETTPDGKIYELGVDLIEFTHSTAQESSTDINHITLTQAGFDALYPYEQMDFQKSAGGDYTLNAEAQKKYIVVQGKIYRKYWPMTADMMPRLSEISISALFNRWGELSKTGTPAEVAAYGKGIPLFDIYGRLVEPPDEWKVSGKNWFWEVSYGYSFNDYKAKPVTDFQVASTYAPKNAVAQTFRQSDLDERRIICALPKSSLTGLKGTALATAAGNPFANIEPSMRSTEILMSNNLANLNKQKANITTQLETGAKSATESIKSAQDTAKTYGTWGKGIGAFLVVAGLGAIGGGFAANYALVGDSQQTLLSQLAEIEKQIIVLKASQQTTLTTINQWLSTNKYTVPDGEWIYHLAVPST